MKKNLGITEAETRTLESRHFHLRQLAHGKSAGMPQSDVPPSEFAVAGVDPARKHKTILTRAKPFIGIDNSPLCRGRLGNKGPSQSPAALIEAGVEN